MPSMLGQLRSTLARKLLPLGNTLSDQLIEYLNASHAERLDVSTLHSFMVNGTFLDPTAHDDIIRSFRADERDLRTGAYIRLIVPLVALNRHGHRRFIESQQKKRPSLFEKNGSRSRNPCNVGQFGCWDGASTALMNHASLIGSLQTNV